MPWTNLRLRRLALLPLFLLLGLPLANHAAPPAPVKAEDAKLLAVYKTATSSLVKHKDVVATVKQEKVLLGAYNIEFYSADDCGKSCQSFKEKGIHVLNHFKQFADVMIRDGDGKASDALWAAPGRLWVEPIGLAQEPPPAEVKKSKLTPKGEPEAIVRGGLSGLKGKKVIIAIIDSGLDFRHEDFTTRDKDGKLHSRLLYLWDTTRKNDPKNKLGKAAHVTYPSGEPIGTIFAQADLTADLQSEDHPIGITDRGHSGHGTACAGIAAGNGKTWTGVAPEADIIGVRVGDEGTGLPNAYLLNTICAWLDEIAGKTPLVVSCSFGGQVGGRDGMLIKERELNERFPEGRAGRVVCIAAGNEGSQGIHGQSEFGGKDEGHFSWDAEEPALLQIYVDKAQVEDVTIEAENFKLKPPDPEMYVHPISHALQINLDIPSGKGGLYLKTTQKNKLRADAYLWSPRPARFTGDCAANKFQVATPGTAPCAIAVGSYDFNADFNSKDAGRVIFYGNPLTGEAMEIGKLSYYSNAGFLRGSEIVKPDIVAPGQIHVAPAAQYGSQQYLDASGKYQSFNGTSAATPYTAGVIALFLEKKPTLSTRDIRQLFQKHATADKFTGKLPNAGWGRGKLDLKAIKRMIEALQ